jgi:hypothetical protein
MPLKGVLTKSSLPLTKNKVSREFPETAIKIDISPGSFGYAPIDHGLKNV